MMNDRSRRRVLLAMPFALLLLLPTSFTGDTALAAPALVDTTGFCESSITARDDAGCGSPLLFDAARDCLDNDAVSWHIEGQYTTGRGSVKFVLECGGTLLVDCTATSVGVPCRSSEVDAEAGELECKYIVTSGNPDGISGNCVDPVHPGFVLEAVPAGPRVDLDGGL